jgi:hypothetical protein
LIPFEITQESENFEKLKEDWYKIKDPLNISPFKIYSSIELK